MTELLLAIATIIPVAVAFQEHLLQVRPANAFIRARGVAGVLSLDAAIGTTTTAKIPIVLLKPVFKVQEIVVAIKCSTT